MKRLILASNSPRRRELLEQIGVEFEVIPSNAEEKVTKQEPSEVVEELSRQKAEDVAAAVEDGIVLGADTVVCQDGQIMGKPKDEADAKQMLQKLQGEEHSVYTGVTILVKENGAVQHVPVSYTHLDVYKRQEHSISFPDLSNRRTEDTPWKNIWLLSFSVQPDA